MCRSITLAGGLALLIWSENDRQMRNQMNTGLPQGAQGSGADRCAGVVILFVVLRHVTSCVSKSLPLMVMRLGEWILKHPTKRAQMVKDADTAKQDRTVNSD